MREKLFYEKVLELQTHCPICGGLLDSAIDGARKFCETKLDIARFSNLSIERRGLLKQDVDGIGKQIYAMIRQAQKAADEFTPKAKHFHKRTFASFAEARDYFDAFSKMSDEVKLFSEWLDVKFLKPVKEYAEAQCDMIFEIFKVATEQPKKFQEKNQKGEQRKMKTQKVFTKQAGWHEIPVEGEKLHEKAKQYQNENPNVSYADALIICDKAMREETELHFSETVVADESAPQEAVEVAKTVKRGVEFTISDGSRWMKVFSDGKDRIFSVRGDNDEVQQFHEQEKNPNKLIVFKQHQPKSTGFSADREVFVERDGTERPVDAGTEDENLEVSVESFINQHMACLNEKRVRADAWRDVAKKACVLLIAGGIDPMNCSHPDANAAIDAAVSDSQKYADALRYAKEIRLFGSFQKAILIAVA